ncbi:DUF3772 domain-containing protein [Henriciella barbarensis]|nr:DUF3772 domain-containing protein [Henriciella barbarensis]
MYSFVRTLLGVVFLALLFFVPVAEAQQTSSERALEDISEIETRLEAINSRLAELANDFESSEEPDELGEHFTEISDLRDSLSTLEAQAIDIRLGSQEALDSVADLIPSETEEGVADAAGSAASGSSGDSSQTAAARLAESDLSGVTAPFREINSRASIAAANARLADIDARRLMENISQSRESVFVSSILERGASPVSPDVWMEAIERTDDVWRELGTEITGWRERQIERGTPYPLAILVGLSLVLFSGLFWLYRLFYKWELRKNTEVRPSRQTVAYVAMGSFLARFATAGAVVLIIAGGAYLLGMNLLESSAGRRVAFVTVAVLCMRALVSSVMAPRTTAFRLIGVGDQAAKAISLSFVVLVIAFAIESILTATGALASPGQALIGVRTFLLSVLTGSLLIWLAVRMRAQTEKGKSTLRIVIRWIVVTVAVTIMLSSLLSYHAFARYIVERLILVSIVLLIAILVREYFRAAALKFLSGVVEERRYQSAREDDDDEPTEMTSEFWIRLSVDTIVVLLLPPFLLLALGLPATELWNEIRWLLAGFEVGGQRISLGSILSAIMTVIAIMVATRLIQRTLERQILPKSQISSGAANSLVTLLGYAGVIIAFVSAIGVIGFDLSSLAIIAGALSVGIGFGLQSIVSNFVAGLILLFERPFKIGDWIVTPSGEGTVQKINVRATEVLTFDRRSIIVPNAELVSNSFGNWTHKSAVMRVAVSVGVKYGTDTRKVEKAMLEVAENIQYVLKDPPPYVVMKGFGDSSLDFELRAYIIADNVVIAPSEIRHELTGVFEREDITIPFPQRDIHFDWPDAPRAMQGENADDDNDDEASKERPSRRNRTRAADEKDETE